MTTLDLAIKNALLLSGSTPEANKAYLEFIKANFIIPIDKKSEADKPEVLFFQDNDHIFLPVFTDMTYFNQWAVEIQDEINILKLSGVDLLKDIADNVTVSLNIGTAFYKEFNPAEIARMRSLILKLFTN